MGIPGLDEMPGPLSLACHLLTFDRYRKCVPVLFALGNETQAPAIGRSRS